MSTKEGDAAVSEHIPIMGVTAGILMQCGLDFVRDTDGKEWRRTMGDYLIALQATGDGTWWLEVVRGESTEPMLDFAGNLGTCLMQYAAVVTAIQAGVLGGSK